MSSSINVYLTQCRQTRCKKKKKESAVQNTKKRYKVPQGFKNDQNPLVNKKIRIAAAHLSGA